MKRFIFIVFIITFVSCGLFTAGAQVLPDAHDTTAVSSSDVVADAGILYEAEKSMAGMFDTIFRIAQFLLLASLLMMSYYVLFACRADKTSTISEKYSILLHKRGSYEFCLGFAVAALIVTVCHFVIQHDLQGSLIWDIVILALVFVVMSIDLMTRKSELKQKREIVDKMSSEDLMMFLTFGKFPIDMTEEEKQRNLNTFQEAAAELGNSLSGDETETVLDEK